ncbi:MAG: DUF721 domain-containing protein [Caldiserica bacterium]|nr:DUF721 domain-containing protein [Caldisericota bacterium]
MKKKEPLKIDSLIEKVLKNAENKKREYIQREDLLRFLETRFNPGISRHIQLGKLRKKRMTIKVDSTIWIMNFRNRELISLINEFLGGDKVDKITLRKQ